MSSGSKRGGPRGPRKNDGRNEEPSAAARRKQMIVSLVMGLIVGVVIALITQFWVWAPAGLAVGLATGAIMKPPVD